MLLKLTWRAAHSFYDAFKYFIVLWRMWYCWSRHLLKCVDTNSISWQRNYWHWRIIMLLRWLIGKDYLKWREKKMCKALINWSSFEWCRFMAASAISRRGTITFDLTSSSWDQSFLIAAVEAHSMTRGLVFPFSSSPMSPAYS